MRFYDEKCLGENAQVELQEIRQIMKQRLFVFNDNSMEIFDGINEENNKNHIVMVNEKEEEILLSDVMSQSKRRNKKIIVQGVVGSGLGCIVQDICKQWIQQQQPEYDVIVCVSACDLKRVQGAFSPLSISKMFLERYLTVSEMIRFE